METKFNFAILIFLVSIANLTGQVQNFPEAEKALEAVILKQKFGEFEYDKHQISSMKNNPQVKGLNGLMFAYYKDKKGNRITMSVQWFKDKNDLKNFYNKSVANKGFKDTLFEKNHLKVFQLKGQSLVYWTDSVNLMVSLGPNAPKELLEAYLKKVPGKK